MKNKNHKKNFIGDVGCWKQNVFSWVAKLCIQYIASTKACIMWIKGKKKK